VKRYEDWILLRRGDIKLNLQGDAHAVEGPHYFTPHIGRTPRGTGVEISIRDFRVADPDGYFLRITSPLRGE
jgi:hypothetical protein